MSSSISQFHLAVPVLNLEEARKFYKNIMGAKEGRSTYNHVDFNLYSHHFVIHVVPEEYQHLFKTFPSDFHGEFVPVPHFGVNLDWDDWSELAERIKRCDYEFYDPPHIRMKGEPGEHATLFLLDPSGNSMEFKAFKNHDEVFEKVFSQNTSKIKGLDELVEKADY